jgi:TolB-like protein
MGGAVCPLYDPGNHHSIEQGSDLQAARHGSLTTPAKPAGERKSDAALLSASIAPPRLSIVVLPFTNFGNDPDQQYFADGITEDLTTDLSRIAHMFVISRSTAFNYRDKSIDARQIGRDLAVRHVLEGSVFADPETRSA